ncbi:hypothetical protein PFICI_07828 [Pestalotiopsis fici W106-1]|uniref:Ubiquitin-like domain-containing protein n=1 Tax=Pestalotiopsis fici (strain W106-1 / CGMCC3.15140) TaxID=1229662 RepID=W3X2R8_PESFW|nr:uncharacterized protein PFICI_07828 [Pestalotiopsis fici W106-1]ETS80299.1 hypothetical protein PFICI_07828 [Pestalotiopsis fici W106-1]
MASTDSDSASGATSPTFTLQIISPSVNVPQPLNFTDLQATTTVQQLKEKIRNAIDAKPSDVAQRLIHRGRLLSKDDDTMLDVFGEDAVRSTEVKTLHLVLRDLSDTRPASVSLPTNTSQPATAPSQNRPAGQTHNQPQQQPQVRNLNAHAHGHFPHLQHAQIHATHHNLPFGFQQPIAAGGAAPPFNYLPPQLQQMQQAQQIAQQQRLHELINQNQRERATLGLHGAQDAPAPAGVSGPQGQNRTASPHRPDGTRTVVREGLGPGGQSWRITVNETVSAQHNPQRNARTGSPFPPPDLQNLFRPPGGAPQPPRSVPLAGPHGGSLSGPDVHSMLRTADAGQAATRVMTDAMRRNASNSSLFNLANSQANQPIPPGVTVPSRTGSAMGTPDPLRAARNHVQPASQPQMQQSIGSEVYILSSPEGPRALLVNGNLGTYQSPNSNVQFPIPAQALRRQYMFPPPPLPPFGLHPGMQAQPGQMHHLPLIANPWVPPAADHATQHNPQHQQQQQQQAQAPAPLPQGLPLIPQAQPRLGHGIAHPGNVQVRAIAVAQLWPHIWMVIRLLLFVWWFTSPTASWQRWFTVTAIAFTLFLVNTGLLTPLAEQFWTPMRRHLDNLMPAADNHGRERPARAGDAQANHGNVGVQGDGGQPNPAEMAARLVRERRVANGNWLMTQARRLERAGILFLASIAPGVAERHIANLEAEARAEQQRREQAEADEQRRIAELAAAEATEASGQPAENSEHAETTAQEPPEERGGDERPEAPEEPLIAI